MYHPMPRNSEFGRNLVSSVAALRTEELGTRPHTREIDDFGENDPRIYWCDFHLLDITKSGQMSEKNA